MFLFIIMIFFSHFDYMYNHYYFGIWMSWNEHNLKKNQKSKIAKEFQRRIFFRKKTWNTVAKCKNNERYRLYGKITNFFAFLFQLDTTVSKLFQNTPCFKEVTPNNAKTKPKTFYFNNSKLLNVKDLTIFGWLDIFCSYMLNCNFLCAFHIFIFSTWNEKGKKCVFGFSYMICT